LGDALHELRKAYIKLIGNTTAPMDPPSPPSIDNDDGFDDRDPSPGPEPPSTSSPLGQRARSTLTPPAPSKGKKKTSCLPLAPSKKQKTVKKKIGPQKKLAYEMTGEKLKEQMYY